MSVEARLRVLEREIASLRRMTPSGPAVSTAFGSASVRPYQGGFPARITAVWDDTVGYEWELIILDRETSPLGTNTVGIPLTGSYAVTPDNDETLEVGTRGWLEPDPMAKGYLFLPGQLSGTGRGFFARLTDSGTNATTSTTGWDFIRVAYTDDSGWGWHDDSAETTGYPAFPLPVDGTLYAADPVAGLRVWVIPSETTAGLYEFMPISGKTVGFARLTATSGGKWDFVWLKLNSSGSYVDDGSATTGYPAVPLTIDGTLLCNPVVGLRVLMLRANTTASGPTTQYEFLPIGMASDTYPGLVSTTTQTMGDGEKTFLKDGHFKLDLDVGTETSVGGTLSVGVDRTPTPGLIEVSGGYAESGSPAPGSIAITIDANGIIRGAESVIGIASDDEDVFVTIGGLTAYTGSVGDARTRAAVTWRAVATDSGSSSGSAQLTLSYASTLALEPTLTETDTRWALASGQIYGGSGVPIIAFGKFGVMQYSGSSFASLRWGITRNIQFKDWLDNPQTAEFVGGILVDVSSDGSGGGSGPAGDESWFDLGETVDVTFSDGTGSCGCMDSLSTTGLAKQSTTAWGDGSNTVDVTGCPDDVPAVFSVAVFWSGDGWRITGPYDGYDCEFVSQDSGTKTVVIRCNASVGTGQSTCTGTFLVTIQGA